MFNKINPIVRNNMFYSEDDFDMETDIAEQYIEEDLNQCIILYQVDKEKTNVNDVYKETNIIRYKAPLEVPCIYEIKESSLKSYDNKKSKGVYMITGNLTFYVMPKTLKKYRCDINRGDYIAVQIEDDRLYYFTVVNDGKVNTANSNYIGAYKTGWRTIECSPASLNEFNGK